MRKKTGKDLASDPLLRRLESCSSPDTVLDVLREKIPGFDQSRSTLTTWVKPTINVMYFLINGWRCRWPGKQTKHRQGHHSRHVRKASDTSGRECETSVPCG